MTADCLPVLLCDRAGTVVGAAHAGWRGLQGGVIEATVRAMGVPAGDLMAWLGPAIGPAAFEVGDEVRAAFVADDPAAAAAFRPAGPAGKWLADLYLLARQRLAALGVAAFMAAMPAPSPSRALLFLPPRWPDGPHGLAGLACLSSGAAPTGGILPAHCKTPMTMTPIAWIVLMSLAGGLLSVLVASGVSYAARPHWVPVLISYAIGALLGAAFLEVLPHAIEAAESPKRPR
jgi:hypothetical protein